MAGRARLANEAWESLLRAHTTVMRGFGAVAPDVDISIKEYDVLYTLSKSPEGMRISDLNRSVLLSQPALSRMLDRLAERGFIGRCSDPNDGRGVLVSLTEDGRRVRAEAGWRHGREVTRALSDRLSEDELAELTALLSKLAGTGPQPPMGSGC